MATVVRVNGVVKTSYVKRGSVSISKVANGRDTFSCVFRSKSAADIYRPVEGDEITYEIEGSIPAGFGGTIVDVQEDAIKDPGIAWAVRVDAVNFTEYLDAVIVDDDWIANGLWDRVNFYHTNYLAPRFGTTYGGPTSGGTLMPASKHVLMKLSDVFDEYAQLTNTMYNIGGNKLLSFVTPGSIAGPVVLSQTNGGLAAGAAQKVTRRKKRLTYFTRGYMKVSAPEGTAQDAQITINNDTFTADGVVGEFPLRYRPVVVAPTQIQINGGAAITLPSSGYSYDASKKAIIKTAPIPTAGTTINVVQYQAKYPVTVVYDDQKTQIRETMLGDAPAGTTLEQAYANAAWHIRSSRATQPKEAIVHTRENGFYVGMSASLSFPKRDVVGTFYVLTVGITDDPDMKPTETRRHRYVLTCVEGTTLVNPWQKDLKGYLGGGSSSGSSISIGSVTPVTGTAGLVGTYTLAESRNAGVMSASYVPIGNGIFLNGDKIPAGATVRLRVLMRTGNAATSVTAKLRRLTGGAADVATTSASTSTAWTEQTITFVPISGWQGYELQIVGSNASNPVYAVGAVDVLA